MRRGSFWCRVSCFKQFFFLFVRKIISISFIHSRRGSIAEVASSNRGAWRMAGIGFYFNETGDPDS